MFPKVTLDESASFNTGNNSLTFATAFSLENFTFEGSGLLAAGISTSPAAMANFI
ncbi:hypothetical protein D3C76_880650 [compost metagenome]